MSSPDENRGRRNSQNLISHLDLGLRFAFSIIIGIGGGYWLDNKLSTSPIFIIIGAIIGFASGFLSIYRAVFPHQNNNSTNE